MKIILASSSKFRINILKKMNLNPEIKIANINESAFPQEKPQELALRLAIQKAKKIVQKEMPDTLVIAADTVSVCNGKILPKSTNDSLVRWCMKQCSGQIRKEITAICIIKKQKYNDIILTELDENYIYLKNFSDSEIDFYVNTKEALNTSGGFCINGLAEIFVNKINGLPSSISGLSMSKLYKMLNQLGFNFLKKI
ncbi:MAG: Maf family protein [Vigna little leaf phytoplasma]|nr:Maf family protein [Vigna little leaf phytoplasma]